MAYGQVHVWDRRSHRTHFMCALNFICDCSQKRTHVYVWRKRLISIKRKWCTPVENGWEEPRQKKKKINNLSATNAAQRLILLFYCFSPPPPSRTIRSLSVFKGVRTKSYLANVNGISLAGKIRIGDFQISEFVTIRKKSIDLVMKYQRFKKYHQQ